MKNITYIILALLLTCIAVSMISCGGGGGGGNILSGTIVNDAGAPLSNGQYSIQDSGTIGSIGQDGKFAAQVSQQAGNIILTNFTAGFRYRRIPFNTSVSGSLDLGNVTLPDNALSKGWGAYRTGDLQTAGTRFNEYLSTFGNDKEALNGLGWTMARGGIENQAIDYLKSALGGGFDADVRTALAAAYFGRTANGTYSLPEAISNLDLAIGVGGFYFSQPIHDSISEDDLIGFRAMVNLLDGRVQQAVTDRNNALGKPDARLNEATVDLLEVVDFFLSD